MAKHRIVVIIYDRVFTLRKLQTVDLHLIEMEYKVDLERVSEAGQWWKEASDHRGIAHSTVGD